MENIRFTSNDDISPLNITYHIDLHGENKSKTLLERVLDKHADYKRIEHVEMHITDSWDYSDQPMNERWPCTSFKDFLLNAPGVKHGDYQHDERYYEPYIYFVNGVVYMYRDLTKVNDALDVLWKAYYGLEDWAMYILTAYNMSVSVDNATLTMSVYADHASNRAAHEPEFEMKMSDGRTFYIQNSWFEYMKDDEEADDYVFDSFDSRAGGLQTEFYNKMHPWPFFSTISSVQELATDYARVLFDDYTDEISPKMVDFLYNMDEDICTQLVEMLEDNDLEKLKDLAVRSKRHAWLKTFQTPRDMAERLEARKRKYVERKTNRDVLTVIGSYAAEPPTNRRRTSVRF